MAVNFLLPLGSRSIKGSVVYGLALCCPDGVDVIWDADDTRLWSLGIARCNGQTWACPAPQARLMCRPSVAGRPTLVQQADLAALALEPNLHVKGAKGAWCLKLLLSLADLTQSIADWPQNRTQPYAVQVRSEGSEFDLVALLGAAPDGVCVTLMAHQDAARALYEADFTGQSTAHLDRITLETGRDVSWRGQIAHALCGQSLKVHVLNREHGKDLAIGLQRARILPEAIDGLKHAMASDHNADHATLRGPWGQLTATAIMI